MKNFNLKHVWLILGVYGVWFATFSGMEEVVHGKYWKVVASLILGVVVYYILELKSKN